MEAASRSLCSQHASARPLRRHVPVLNTCDHHVEAIQVQPGHLQVADSLPVLESIPANGDVIPGRSFASAVRCVSRTVWPANSFGQRESLAHSNATKKCPTLAAGWGRACRIQGAVARTGESTLAVSKLHSPYLWGES